MMKMANWPVLNHYDFELVESDYLPSFSFYKFLVVLGGCTALRSASSSKMTFFGLFQNRGDGGSSQGHFPK